MAMLPTHLVSSSGLGNSHGDTENGVGSKLSLVVGTVKLDHEVVNLLLGGDGELGVDQSRGDDVVDVVDSLGNTFRPSVTP
jgi:hypothetical protein